MRSSAACGTGNLTVSAGSSHSDSALLTGHAKQRRVPPRHGGIFRLLVPPPRNASQSGCRNPGLQGRVVIPGIGAVAAAPALTRIASQCGLWLAYWRLRPLWAAMVAAVPDMELPAERGTRSGIRWRLLRRVIEIRDAELALRPYWREEVAAAASAAARSAGLDADLEQAVVEAAVAMDAARACLRGGPPACEQVPAERICGPAGNELRSEIARLILVSRAVRRCPVVRDLALTAR